MKTALDAAVEIGRIIGEADRLHTAFDYELAADYLAVRFGETGLEREDILGAVREEATAAGLTCENRVIAVRQLVRHPGR